jgi:hypothetical protein
MEPAMPMLAKNDLRNVSAIANTAMPVHGLSHVT